MNTQALAASFLTLSAFLAAFLASHRRRDALEIVAIEPDRLTSEDGTIRTNILINNPASQDNYIVNVGVSVSDAYVHHTLEVAASEKDLPLHSTAKMYLVASNFQAEKLSRECVFQADLTDVFGRKYRFRQPFINMLAVQPKSICR